MYTVLCMALSALHQLCHHYCASRQNGGFDQDYFSFVFDERKIFVKNKAYLQTLCIIYNKLR